MALRPGAPESDSRDQNLASAFVDAADRHRERLAVVEGSRALSFSDLLRLSMSVANGLTQRGIRPGDHVMITLPRGADFIASILGVTLAGGVYVPADPGWPEERLASLRGIVRPAVTVTGSATDRPRSDVLVAELFGSPPVAGPAPTGADDPCYVMFTSGTTGEPKGVAVPHRAVLRLVLGQDYASIEPGRVWLQLAATSFDASTLEIWGPLLNGGCCVPVPEDTPSLDRIADLIGSNRVTDAWLTSSLFNAMVDHSPGAFKHMRQVLTGGERLSPTHVRRFMDLAPRTTLINGYGPTENTTFTCCHTITRADVDNPAGIPIGRPIRGTDVRIVGADDREVGAGESGELLAGGSGVALGYIGDDELTARRFVRLADSDGVWYRTGDMARSRADGVIEFLGRIDRQVKVRGYRVELEEVERRIASHPAVDAAHAMVIGDRADLKQLAAAYTCREGHEALEAAELRAWLAERVPGHIVPDLLRRLESTPIGPTGKADLAAIQRELAGEITAAETGVDDPVPMGDPAAWDRLQCAIREILPGSQPNPELSFVEIGGHSIAALRLSANLREKLSLEIPVGQILEATTLGELACEIRAAGHSPSIDRGFPEPGGPIPASSMQEQLYFESQVDPTGSAYHEYAAFHAGTGLDIEALRRAWAALVERHEILRTRFELSEDALTQHVDPPGTLEPNFLFTPGEVAWEASGPPLAVVRVIGTPFDLKAEHPARLNVFELAEGGHAIVLVFHHVAIDEWSLGIIAEELSALYTNETELPPPVPFRVYTEHELHHRSASRIDLTARSLLASMGGRTSSAHAPAPGVHRALSCGGLTVQALADRASRVGCTPPAYLLGLFAEALCETLCRPNLVILTPLSRRIDRTLQNVLGCCNVMQPVVTEPVSEPAVHAARRQLIDAYVYGIAPFTDVVRSVQSHSKHRAPPIEFGFATRTLPAFLPALPGIDTRPLRCDNTAARFPLGINIDLSGALIAGSLSAPARSDLAGCLPELSATFEEFLGGADPRARKRGAALRSSGTPRPRLPEAELDAALLSAVRRAWESLTGSPATPESDFFEHGGHSILLLRMAARIREETGLEIPLNTFLEQPTFTRLVSCLAEQRKDTPGREPFQIENIGGAERAIVCIPGMTGRPIMFSRLADSLQELTSGRIGLRAYNLYDAVDTHGAVRGIDVLIDQLDSDLRSPNVAGVLGYSLGGWFPLLLGDLPPAIAHQSFLWLLDVFPPSILEARQHRWTWALRNAARHPSGVLRAVGDSASLVFNMTRATVTKQPALPRLDAETEARFHGEMRQRTMKPWEGAASVMDTEKRPLWHPYLDHRQLNGLEPYLAGPRRHVSFDEWHANLLVKQAGEIARVICEDLRVPVGKTT